MAEEKKTCRICLQPSFDFPMGEKNGHRLVACRACGSVATDPWPTQKEIDDLYGEIQPEAVHLPNPEREISHIKKLLTGMAVQHAGRRFLDVSCRHGYGVMAAKELGFQKVHGIDSHGFYISFAKDRYPAELFEHVTLQEYAARGEQAEVIYAADSFCEQVDPDGYMAALAKTLTPGGSLYIHEPDGNHFRLPRKFDRWAAVEPPLFFSFLSVRGMEILLKRHGLKIQKKFFCWSPVMRLLVSK